MRSRAFAYGTVVGLFGLALGVVIAFGLIGLIEWHRLSTPCVTATEFRAAPGRSVRPGGEVVIHAAGVRAERCVSDGGERFLRRIEGGVVKEIHAIGRTLSGGFDPGAFDVRFAVPVPAPIQSGCHSYVASLRFTRPTFSGELQQRVMLATPPFYVGPPGSEETCP